MGYAKYVLEQRQKEKAMKTTGKISVNEKPQIVKKIIKDESIFLFRETIFYNRR